VLNKIFHHTSNASLHYLVKYCQKNSNILKHTLRLTIRYITR